MILAPLFPVCLKHPVLIKTLLLKYEMCSDWLAGLCVVIGKSLKSVFQKWHAPYHKSLICLAVNINDAAYFDIPIWAQSSGIHIFFTVYDL